MSRLPSSYFSLPECCDYRCVPLLKALVFFKAPSHHCHFAPALLSPVVQPQWLTGVPPKIVVSWFLDLCATCFICLGACPWPRCSPSLLSLNQLREIIVEFIHCMACSWKKIAERKRDPGRLFCSLIVLQINHKAN